MNRVVIVAFEGVQTLDVTGPAEVFAAAGRAAGRALYRLAYASVGGGARRTSASLEIGTRDLLAMRPRAEDIVLVAGGEEGPIRDAAGDERLQAWLRRASAVVRALGSVCSGAFVLAAAGLLDGRRAATHWEGCDRLARSFPKVSVDRDAIFVRDGAVWTSAGVTTGIDMALAMVEADHGAALAHAIAGRLVLYVRRPGFQSQFSDALIAQQAHDDPLGPAIAWARAHLAEADVPALARRAGVSERTLHRRCAALLGTTPARLLDRLRVEQARALLAADGAEAKVVAHRCGFGNAVRMKRAFVRELGMAPRAYQTLHGSVTSPPRGRVHPVEPRRERGA